MKTILLNPGPVTLSPRVRKAMLRADLCHRESEFATLQNGLRRKLLKTYDLAPESWCAALMTGSGTAAVESMISSLVPAERAVLVIENGVYGERMSRIAETYGIATIKVTVAWGEPIDPDTVAAALAANPNISHVAVVHHETTTGRLNDLSALSELCKAHDVQILLDAVSSFGAESIDIENWPIAALAATANKCLHGVPGTCFVILRRDALPTAKARSVYLDLASYVKAQDNAGTPFTQSIQTFYALDEALDELEDGGGVSARGQLYRRRMAGIRGVLADLKVSALLPDDACSCVLHAYELPQHLNYEDLHDALKHDGFIIYAGQGNYAAKIFRISMMGDINADDIERLETSLRRTIGA